MVHGVRQNVGFLTSLCIETLLVLRVGDDGHKGFCLFLCTFENEMKSILAYSVCVCLCVSVRTAVGECGGIQSIYDKRVRQPNCTCQT